MFSFANFLLNFQELFLPRFFMSSFVCFILEYKSQPFKSF